MVPRSVDTVESIRGEHDVMVWPWNAFQFRGVVGELAMRMWAYVGRPVTANRAPKSCNLCLRHLTGADTGFKHRRVLPVSDLEQRRHLRQVPP